MMKIVACINDKFTLEQKQRIGAWPTRGMLYTVRETVDFKNGKYGYLLHEVVNTPDKIFKVEPSFRTERFMTIAEVDGLELFYTNIKDMVN